MTHEISIGRLLFLRRVTREFSNTLVSELKGHLNTISPLLRPRRLLGDYIESGSPEQVVEADKNFTLLSEIYAKAAGKPFELPRPLRPPLKPIGLSLEVYPWESQYEIRSGSARKVCNHHFSRALRSLLRIRLKPLAIAAGNRRKRGAEEGRRA